MTSQHSVDPRTGLSTASTSDPSTTANHSKAAQRATLPRSRMLKSSARITELFAKGLRVHGGLLSVHHLPGSSLVAFVIPRRYGRAVDRNRAKRRLREIFRLHGEWFPAQRDWVIYIRPKVGLADHASFLKDLEQITRRIRRHLQAAKTSQSTPPAP